MRNKNQSVDHLAICYDLDSTLFNVEHRAHLAPEGLDKADNANWIPYSKACVDDEAVEGVAASARLYHAAGFYIYILSGRNIEALDQTILALRLNNIPWDAIRLHRDSDLRHNGEYKVKALNDLKDSGITPVLMFEDHQSVCEAIEKEAGVPCVTVAPRYKDEIGVSFNLNEYPDLANA